MARTHLITGGTGFVGSALIVELLQRTRDDIVGVVRPRPGISATQRLREAALAAVTAYDAPPSLAAQIEVRVQAVAGDVADPSLTAAELPVGDYDQCWHSAASLRFEDRYRDEIFQTNTEGTRHVIELAARVDARHFNYFSTTYVAGSREGQILEAPCSGGRPNNRYEESKARAEALLEQERRFGVRILRPSIVIGHSETMQATNFTGMYGFFRKLYAYRGMMERTQPGLAQRRALQVVFDHDAPLDLVPVDHVVADAVQIVERTPLAPGQVRFFHLNNPQPPPTGEVMATMCKRLGIAMPRPAQPDQEMDWLETRFNDQIDFYRSYIRGQKRFCRAHTDEVAGRREAGVPMAVIDGQLGWYEQQLEEERASLPARR